MKLHLGCGLVYLDGYVNVDYPLSEHSVQHSSVADKLVDITKLSYKQDSIEEIRLHHVFEHFDRATACALILIWSNWLEPAGLLRIEVPDFERTAKTVLSRWNSQNRGVGLRHIFGSQEASWAVHYHGWSERDLRELLRMSGFKIERMARTAWKGTYNIEVYARKESSNISSSKAIKICRNWLSQFLVDETKSEIELLRHWTEISKKQLRAGIKG